MSNSYDGVDVEQMKARLAECLKRERISFQKLCDDAVVSRDDALRAINVEHGDLMVHLPKLQSLSLALGRNPDWLLLGISTDPRDQTEEARVTRLVLEFKNRTNISPERYKLLLNAALSTLSDYDNRNVTVRLRRRVPASMKDVTRIYLELFGDNQ